MTSSLLSERRDLDESVSRMNSSQHLGTAVKQLAPIDLQSSFISDKSNNGCNVSPSSVQLKRNLGMHRNKVWESWFTRDNVVRGFSSVAVLGCIFFASFRLTSMNVNNARSASKYVPSKSNAPASSVTWQTDYSVDNNLVPAYIKGDGISEGFKKIFAMITTQFKNNADAGNTKTSWPTAGLSSSARAMSRRLMSMDEAEDLVKQWQEIKAQALGPNHQVNSLYEILDESMLAQVNSSIPFKHLCSHLTIDP